MDNPRPDAVTCPGNSFRCAPLTRDNPLPLVIEPDEGEGHAVTMEDLLDWFTSNATWVESSLLEYGGILFRGFPVSGPPEFGRVLRVLQPDLLPYTEGQSQRSRILSNIYTSTEYPSDQDITLHNELSYTANPPYRLFFYCQLAPAQGGETPIADCRRAYGTMEPSIRNEFVERRIRYVKNMHGDEGFGKSWQEHFETRDREAVESYLRASDVEFRWKPDGSLWTSQTRPAAIDHPDTGERVWFNQADLWHYSNLGEKGEVLRRLYGEDGLPTNAYFGDGGAISPEALDTVRRHFWQQASLFSWQQGDVLCLDNKLVAHGRKAFKGQRRILVAMA